jgi:hypothetical protein
MTILKLPEGLTWTKPPTTPEKSLENAPLWGGYSKAGLYYYLHARMRVFSIADDAMSASVAS